MLERLLFGNSLFKDYFDFWGDEFSSLFNGFGKQMFNNASKFIPTSDGYKLSMDVDTNSTADNVEINLEKDGMVDIKYHIKSEHSEHMVNVKEYLPKDANPNTLDAEIVKGKLIVTVKYKDKSYNAIDKDGNLYEIEIKK